MSNEQVAPETKEVTVTLLLSGKGKLIDFT